MKIKIFIERINLINLIPIIFLTYFGISFWYLSVSRILRNYKIINFLKKKKINLIDFSKQEYNNQFYIGEVRNKARDNLINEVIGYSKKVNFDNLLSFFPNIEIFQIFLIQKNEEKNFNYFLIDAIAKSMGNNKFSYYWFNNNLAIINFLPYEIKKKNIRPFFFILFDIITLSFLYLIKFIKTFYKKKKLLFQKKSIFKTADNLKLDKQMFKRRYIFFPHKGIKSQYSKKDYFFISEKVEKDQFLILEYNFDFHPNSVELYNLEYNFNFWSNITIKKIFDKSFFISLIKNYKYFFFYKDFYSIIKAKYKLKKFTKLEKVFIGDEINFPIQIAIALKLLNLQIYAYQKRINVLADKKQILVDKYFILGKKSKDDLVYQLNKNIKTFEVGNYELNEKVNLLNNFKDGKHKLYCLVLDQATLNKKFWYENCTNPIFNYYSHYSFIENVIKLSKKFKDIFFSIKSKHLNWLDDEKYTSLLADLNNQTNIKIFKNLKYISNFSFFSSYDFAVGRHTSLLDDFLSFGKPIIIYDDSHLFSKNINYGSDIMTDNYIDLEKKFTQIYENYNLSKSHQEKIKNYLFYKFDKDNYLKYLETELID